MPWPRRIIVSIREELILKVLSKEDSIVELADQYGVSRKTVYKWLARYQKRGLAGLVDESRRPHSSPMKTSAEMALEIVQMKKEHPTWGPKKLAGVLMSKYPDKPIPSVVTIGRVLRDMGLMKRRRRRESGGLAFTPAHFVPVEPNDLWTVDFKGWWKTKDGAKCEPLTVRDAVSRYVLSVKLMTRTRGEDVRPVFEDLFARFGLPKAIQSDNGSPFASTCALGGFTKLSAWWVSLGIHVVRSRPGHPQDNGAHERMHCDMRFELEDDAEMTLSAQQRACDEWTTTFNHVRPHEALGQKLPAEVYRVSPRRLQKNHRVVGGYPDGCRQMTVGRQGVIRCQGWKAYVSTALAGYTVGLQSCDDGSVLVWFFHVLLGSLVPGRDDTVEPVAGSEVRYEPMNIIVRTEQLASIV
jgi:putative transposase